MQEAAQLMLMMPGSACPAADHVRETVQLMLMMRGSGGRLRLARLPINVQEATQLMLMMLGSGGPAADPVQQPTQLMLIMLGSGGLAAHHVQEADADDARVGWPGCRSCSRRNTADGACKKVCS